MIDRDLSFRRQLPMSLTFKGRDVDVGYRVDFLVEDTVVVELKSVRALERIHTAQVLTYLKLGGWPIALLINFNATYLGDGAVRRIVQGYRGPLPRAPR